MDKSLLVNDKQFSDVSFLVGKQPDERVEMYGSKILLAIHSPVRFFGGFALRQAP